MILLILVSPAMIRKLREVSEKKKPEIASRFFIAPNRIVFFIC
jgi:hypothetical protein